MNLGIVIAVSDYGNLGSNLPGCVVDGEAVSTILRTDNKFDDVLVITKKTKSSEVKHYLIDFINKHKDEDVGDVVFYFTGHGDFSGDEFYFLLSDYDRKKIKQTSLENSELDDLLRSLEPQNTIKIVDACHSGTPYIKDSESFDTYLKGTKGKFEKCYFMFSSQADQYSYQDSKLSYFTKSIIESVYQHTSTNIRYKDIIDHVSDSFIEINSQTPFFIVQADFTESFCTVSDTLKLSLSSFLKGSPEKNTQNKKLSVTDLIKAEAKGYCSEIEAINQLDEVISKVAKSNLDSELNDLYSLNLNEKSDYEDIPNIIDIGKWLETNDHSFFAEPTKKYIEVSKKIPKNSKNNNILGIVSVKSFFDEIDDNEKYKTINTLENRISGFKSTVDLPLTMLKIDAEAAYPNIQSAAGYLLPVISKTTLKIFYTFSFYEEIGWSERKLNSAVKWSAYNIKLKGDNSSDEFSKFIMNEFSKYLFTPLVERFGLEKDQKKSENIPKKGIDNNPDKK